MPTATIEKPVTNSVTANVIPGSVTLLLSAVVVNA